MSARSPRSRCWTARILAVALLNSTLGLQATGALAAATHRHPGISNTRPPTLGAGLAGPATQPTQTWMGPARLTQTGPTSRPLTGTGLPPGLAPQWSNTPARVGIPSVGFGARSIIPDASIPGGPTATPRQIHGNQSLPQRETAGHPYPGDAAIKSRRLTDATFVMVDIEISSFFPWAEVSGVTEIGGVKFRIAGDGSFQIVGTFQQQIDPQLPLDERITELNGMTPADLKGQPTLDQAWPRFQEFLGKDSIVLAHNAPFDLSFLGYHGKALGLPAAPHLVLDTKEIAKSVLPGLRSYSVQPLIEALGLGQIEEHRGLADSLDQARIFARCVSKLAQETGIPIPSLTVADLAKRSESLHFDTILERMAARDVEPDRRRPLPDNWLEELERIQKKNHRDGRSNMLRDVAYELGVGYDELRDKLAEAHRKVRVSRADEILGDLVRNPAAALILDFDGTLTDRDHNGLTLPVSPAHIAAMEGHLRLGVPIVIGSARNYDFQPPEAVLPDSKLPVPYAIYDALITRIAPELRRHLLFVGGLAGEVVGFDALGRELRHLLTPWTKEEESRILTILDRTLKAQGVAKDEIALVTSNPNQVFIIFKLDEVDRAQAFGVALQKEFTSSAIPYPVLSRKHWIYFSKFQKGEGSRIGYLILKALGYPVREDNLLFVADEFEMPQGKPPGGDASMVLPFPNSRGISVEEAPQEELPSNVLRLGIKNGRGSLRVLQANLEGLLTRTAQEPQGENPQHPDRTEPSAQRSPSQPDLGNVARLTLLLSGAAAGLSVPWLWAHAAVSAALGSVLLTVIGLPILWTNFRMGAEATKDQAVDGYLHWLGASLFLTLTSILNGVSPAWIAANVAGVAESALASLQVQSTSPNPQAWRSGLRNLAIGILAFGAAAAVLPLPAASFAVAVVFLYSISIPQIRKNLALWKTEGRPPTGLDPRYPMLVASGSFLHLLAAVATQNTLWAINASVAILSTLLVLSQVYFPATTNATLDWMARAITRSGHGKAHGKL